MAGAPAPSAQPWWSATRRLLTLAFVALVLWLLVQQARDIDWPAVAVALRQYRWPTLLAAVALAIASFIAYACYDLVGRYCSGHRLGTGAVLGVAFVSYVSNLNFGAWIGGIGMRLRLYGRLGLSAGTVAEVYGFSVVTNWLGYAALAGAVFLWRPFDLPPGWHVGSAGLRWLGAALLLAVAAYLTLCFVGRRREWSVRGQRLRLPDGRMAMLQLALSSANWLLIAVIVDVLLQRRIEFSAVLGVLLVAAMAGVITHIPAGLGVLEAVFLALLGQRLPHAELLGALLAYRAVYYLLPLLPALLAYLILTAGPGGRDAPGAHARARELPAPDPGRPNH